MSKKPAPDDPQPLCDWSKKDFRDRFDDLCAAVRSPRYACVKCGRAAGDKRLLCKAKALKGK